MASLADIPGLRESRRVGTDGLTPMFGDLISQLVGSAELVDAAPVMAAARRIKTADEITCLEVASAISESALSAMEEALRPGITERELLGIYDEHVARLGAPTAAFGKRLLRNAFAWASSDSGIWHRIALSGMANWWCSRRVPCMPDTRLALRAPGWLGCRLRRKRRIWRRRCARGMDALLAACRPGAVGADLYRAWEDAGNSDSPVPLAHGLGLGAEPPVIGLGRGSEALLEEGMVLSVQSWVAEEGVGGCLERATVVIESGGAVGAHSVRKVVMSSHQTIFNHVGLCVADRERSRRFYEGLLGFQFWWELERA